MSLWKRIKGLLKPDPVQEIRFTAEEMKGLTAEEWLTLVERRLREVSDEEGH